MNRKEMIVDFLKNSNIFPSLNGCKPHYNVNQINLFSAGPGWNIPLNVTEEEMENFAKGREISFYEFEDHGKCYYAV